MPENVLRKAIHVLLTRGQWAVVRYGEAVPLSFHDQREDAIAAARAIVKRDGSDLVIFDLGGRPVVHEPGATGSAE